MRKLTVATRGLILLVLAFPAWAAQLTGEVVAITDGDTLTLLADRTQHKIRLAEIDTPESGQPWGNRARQALADKVFRKPVRVEVADVDRYGRTVGKIWLAAGHDPGVAVAFQMLAPRMLEASAISRYAQIGDRHELRGALPEILEVEEGLDLAEREYRLDDQQIEELRTLLERLAAPDSANPAEPTDD